MRLGIIILLFTIITLSSGFNCQDYSLTETKTGSSGGKKPIPDAPSNLIATLISQTQINLSWTDNSKVEQGFKIERKTLTAEYSLLTTVGPNVTSYSDTGLTDGITYYYRICAYNKSGNSAYSNEASLSIALNAPTSLTVTLISSTQLNLSWIDNSGAESGYKIERKTGAGGTYAQIDTVGANVTFYPNTGLTDGITYYYRVRAYNSNGDSAYSNDASTAISLNAPTNLITTTVTSSQINLQWSDNSGNETGFKIERKIGIGGTYGQIYTTNSNIISYSNTGLTLGVTYYYRIRAYNSNGDSLYSNETYGSTHDTTPPSIPTGLIAAVVSSAQINLTWSASTDNVGVTGYNIYRNGVQIDTSSVTLYSDTGLSPTTTYTYTVEAYDAVGNISAQSFPTSATTTAAGTAVDDYVWVANANSNTVTRIKKSDSSTTTITAGTNPYGVAVDTTYVWVTNEISNNVTRIKKSDLTTTTITAGTLPLGIALDATYVWVTNLNSNNVTRIDKSDLTTTTIAAGTNPFGVAVDSTYVWVVNRANDNVTRIQKSNLITTTIAVGDFPMGVAVDLDYVWVANDDDNTVTRIKKSDLTTTTIAVENFPYGVAVDDTYVWVTNNTSNNVTRIKKSDLTKTTIAVGTFPFGVAVDDTYVWVTNNTTSKVTRIDKSDLTTTMITVGHGPASLGDMTGYAYDNYSNSIPTSLSDWSAVASRTAHNIALKTNNTIWGWGFNDWGQLGVGDYTSRNTPSQISTITDWSVINVGAGHSLALKSTGILWAWGLNDYGQLGDNTTNSKTTPRQIGTDSDWHIITGGNSHSVGIKNNYTIWAWGYNSFGQLGLGDVTDRHTPSQIGTDSDWFTVSLGLHNCFSLKSNSTLWTWGGNNYGQLGLGDIGIDRKTPTQIGIDSDWSRIFTGNTFHTFAFKTNQLMWAWGVNDYGQLGDGTTINRITPIQIGINSDWSIISVGNSHTIGLKTNATLWSWGRNNYGQLGDGTTTGRTTPGNIGTDSDWSTPASGSNHSMGIKLNCTLWIWGYNLYDQLGLGDTIDRWTPTMVGE